MAFFYTPGRFSQDGSAANAGNGWKSSLKTVKSISREVKSLSELSNVYTNVSQMCLVPFCTPRSLRHRASLAAVHDDPFARRSAEIPAQNDLSLRRETQLRRVTSLAFA